jgi:hypothetical protein
LSRAATPRNKKKKVKEAVVIKLGDVIKPVID